MGDFPGEGKIFHVGKNTICRKKVQKRYFFHKKSKTFYFWPWQVRGGGGQKSPLVPSPPDAHDVNPIFVVAKTIIACLVGFPLHLTRDFILTTNFALSLSLSLS
jgi:hypothetical protein